MQNAPTRRLTPKSINASVFVTTTGTTWDNLKLSFAGATEMPRNIIAHELLGNIFFAHELHELTRRLCAKKNGDRVGRTNLHECKEFFIYMSCGVVPSRHIVLTSPIRALRTRLPSLRSVVPSRHKRYMNTNVPTSCDSLGRSFISRRVYR